MVIQDLLKDNPKLLHEAIKCQTIQEFANFISEHHIETTNDEMIEAFFDLASTDNIKELSEETLSSIYGGTTTQLLKEGKEVDMYSPACSKFDKGPISLFLSPSQGNICAICKHARRLPNRRGKALCSIQK